ncbi:DUF5928 domain-containing protein [Paracoccus sp. (in: a-proteobacteria)]|uniref:DUF5928 domain-containing protein n=1 Tax=Paracoccus sp. TaxID=267 RepID=UPI0026E07BC1|nr:DUF5928 domain-containing protein [Paracoccus sp. (in: a-proteobacteria)]MDO5648638.1 DUF5928 domain-containing protein [Paracoccus sp. (in: a-proteobacteria)]
MANIAFLLLTHKDPDGVIAQVGQLTAAGDFAVVHYDRRAPAADYQRLVDGLAGNPSAVVLNRRLKCGWGEWSLVDASLRMLRRAEEAFPQATHFYLMSGDCRPIKTAEYAKGFLDANDCDQIESFDFFNSGWIKTGLREERLIYRYWFNERTQARLFYASLAVQQRLGLTRAVPDNLAVMIGSQWWCLRRQTVESVLELIDSRPEILAFFRTTWIPDETFFQTLVAHVVPSDQIMRRSPTFLMFTDYGMPVNFYDDHLDLLMRQSHLFARKISPEAKRLHATLGKIWPETGQSFSVTDDGVRMFHYLTGRGRVGGRYAPRIWQAGTSAGRNRVVHLIVAKKWHVAKRLTAAIRQHTDIPALDYIFNEDHAGLPDLGGIGSSVVKRERHRKALLGLLFEHYDRRHLVLCVDPSALSLIRDFVDDRSETRILFVDTPFTDDYILGHMQRIGLIADATPDNVVQSLLPVMRAQLQAEAESLHDQGFQHFATLGDDNHGANQRAIAQFLDVSDEQAGHIANTPHLFAD